MKALITGGAGFIGSAVVRRLLADGHQATVFDNLETGVRTNVPAEATFIEGDIRDVAALEAACKGQDLVIHLAAMVSVALSVTEPKLCWEVNVEGTRNALAAAHNAGCKRLVLASSAAVYGNAPGLPKQEEMVATPASPYGYSKWQNEVDAAYYGNYMGLETACMRFFNVFGPRQRPDSPYSGVISIASRQLLNDATFTVFGTGEQTRDFVFVEDVAGAVVTAALHPGVKADVFNVGRGERVSLLELVEALGKALGKTPKLAYAEPRAGDVLHSLADVTRLNQKLGYVARVPLAEGLAATGAWMREGTQQPVGF